MACAPAKNKERKKKKTHAYEKQGQFIFLTVNKIEGITGRK